MIINISCLYLLVFTGIQCSLGLKASYAKFGPLYQRRSTAPIEETRLETYKVQDVAAQVLVESQTSMSIREYEDATNNFNPTYDDKSFSISRINDNVIFINDTSIYDVFAEKSSQIIVLIDKFNDKMVRVRNKIDKVITTLTIDSDIQRPKRSFVVSGSTTTSTLSTVLVNSHYSSRLTELENNISKMIEHIDKLKKSMSFSDEDKERFSTLEDRAINLEKLVDNLSRAVNEEVESMKIALDSLSNSLNTDLFVLREKVAEQERSQNRKGLMAESIKEIQSHNFQAAADKLNLIDDDGEINLIVHQVYNNEAANFRLVREFADNINNLSRRFLVYKALNYEMKSNRHRDKFKLDMLIDSLNILYGTDVIASDTKRNVQSLLSEIYRKIIFENIGKERMKNSMMRDNYASVVHLAETLYNADHELFKEFIGEVVNEVYGRISIEKLVSSIPNERKYGEQAVPAYFAVLDEMERRGEFNNNAIFKVAYGIKRSAWSKNPNFSGLKNRLPESVRNAVFASKVCIKNVMYNERLYSAHGAGHTYGKDRRYVFARIPGDKVMEADWIIEPDGDNFYIKNYIRSEYLYSDRPYGYTFNNDSSYVFTWIPGTKVPESRWKIEPYGDKCYIKYVKSNEYLYSAYPDGPVNTWIPGNKVSIAEWKIEDCS